MSTSVHTKLFLDAGHGGSDKGACHYGIIESDLNLFLADKTYDVLCALGYGEAVTCSRYACSSTRDDDKRKLTVATRVRLAQMDHAEIAFCVHTNSNPNENVRGLNLFVLPRHSARLSEVIDTLLMYWPGTLINPESGHQTVFIARDDPTKQTDDWKRRAINVLHPYEDAGIEPILIEVGYCTNKEDADALARETVQNQIALALAQAYLAIL